MRVETGTNEVDGSAVIANARSSLVDQNFLVGQLLWDGNHYASHSHNFDLMTRKWCPLSGLSSVVQNLHESTPVTTWIPVTWWVVITLFHFLPLNQWSTVWLSVQNMYTKHLSGISAPGMKLHSLSAVSAAISCNLGSMSGLRGPTWALAIAKATSWYYATSKNQVPQQLLGHSMLSIQAHKLQLFNN